MHLGTRIIVFWKRLCPIKLWLYCPSELNDTSEIFQTVWKQATEGIAGGSCIIDDILVLRNTDERQEKWQQQEIKLSLDHIELYRESLEF